MEPLRSLLEAAPDAMIAVTAGGRIVLANAQAEELFGYESGSLEDQLVEVLVPRSVRALHPLHRARYVDDPVTRPMGAGLELQAQRQDGTTFPAEISLTTLEMDPEPLVIAAVRDVSEHHRAEARFRAVLEAAPDALVGVDGNGRIVFVNGQVERLFGYPRDELLGERIEILVPEGARTVHPGHRARYVTHPVTRPMGAGLQLEGRRRDGSTFPADISLSSITTEQGTLVTTAIRDVTERNEAEQAVRAARDEAERANRAKSEFLSRMSHELRTPLNAILGFGQLLELDDPEPRQAERIGFILKAGRHLLELIDEVLDISRIEAGELQVTPEAVAVGGHLREVVELLRPIAEEHAVVVRVDPDADDGVAVWADVQRLRQVSLNLVVNAIRYNRAGGTVDLSWLVDGSTVRISVTDTGIGIREELQDRLFLPFERLGGEAAADGTGLGLALSRSLVTSMGGDMGARSVPDVGSTFWFELPAAGEASPADRREASPTPRRVLHVEDNPSNLRLVEDILAERGGVHVIPALRGEQAAALARQFQPDVVVLDLHLPDVDGEVVLAQLAADPVTSTIPVVIVTADATEERAEALRRRGVFAFATKPLDVARFLELIESAFAAAPARDRAPAPES